MDEPTIRDGSPDGLGASPFPVVVALEAMERWLRAPTGERRARLREALHRIVEAAGARGAYLAFEASPLPRFSAGFGSLSTKPEDEPSGEIQRFPLVADGGRVSLGDLWLDGSSAGTSSTVRAVELSLDAGWARAEAAAAAARLEALDEATRTISRVLDVEAVLQVIVDRVRDLVRADYAALGIVDASGRIERFVTSGLSRSDRDLIGAPPRGHGLLGLIIREGRSFRIAEIQKHPDSYGFPPNHPPMHSFLGVPVRVKSGSIGNLYLTNKRDAEGFSEQDQRIVEMFAVHAGIAMENARLHEQVQELAVIRERDRIGKDLHDGIIQQIYAVALSLEDVPEIMAAEPEEAAARVDRAIDRLNVAILDIRNFIVGLGLGEETGAGLVVALAALAEEAGRDSLVEIDVDLDSADAVADALPPHVGMQLLQIAREAISNVARHSAARHATIRLAPERGGARLEVVDDGRGFDPGTAATAGHFGLANMRERSAAIGATLETESRPGAGSRIIVRLPLGASEAEPS